MLITGTMATGMDAIMTVTMVVDTTEGTTMIKATVVALSVATTIVTTGNTATGMTGTIDTPVQHHRRSDVLNTFMTGDRVPDSATQASSKSPAGTELAGLLVISAGSGNEPLHHFNYLLPVFQLGFAQVVRRLQVQPKLRSGVQACCQAQCHISRNSTPLKQYVVYGWGGHA